MAAAAAVAAAVALLANVGSTRDCAVGRRRPSDGCRIDGMRAWALERARVNIGRLWPKQPLTVYPSNADKGLGRLFAVYANPAKPFDSEELPSLGDVVLRRHVPAGSYTIAADLVAKAGERFRSGRPSAPVWVEAMPSPLNLLTSSAPLCETELGGLDSRKIIEPVVFRHVFGLNTR